MESGYSSGGDASACAGLAGDSADAYVDVVDSLGEWSGAR